MATAYTAIIEALFREPGLTGPEISNRLGYKFSATAISTTSLTTSDPLLIKMGTQILDNLLQGWHIYLATNTEERMVTTSSISGSTLTINFLGGNATAVASPSTVYISRVSWSELKAGANEALTFIPIECIDVLRHGPDDAFMQASATTSWTGTNATIAKQTTAAEVLHGARSTSVTLSAGSGYVTSTTSRIGQAESAIVNVIAKADIGTGIVRALDQSGNTIDSDNDITFTQEQWVYLRKYVTVDADDEGLAIRILGTDNLDQIDVQAAWIVNVAENNFPLPTYIDSPFKLKAVARREYGQAGMGANSADTWLAKSYRDIRLQEGVDYRFVDLKADANPLGLEMLTDWYRHHPIMLFAETPASEPYGVSAAFTTDASTTNVRPHLLTAYMKKWIGGLYPDLFPGAERLGEREFKERMNASRTPLPALPTWHGPSRRRI